MEAFYKSVGVTIQKKLRTFKNDVLVKAHLCKFVYLLFVSLQLFELNIYLLESLVNRFRCNFKIIKI